MELPVKLDFFPSLQLTKDDTTYYQSLAEQSITLLTQLIREDQWKRVSDHKGLSIGKCHSIHAAQACIMFCASVYTTGSIQEVLDAIASPITTEYRKSMSFLHSERFEDAICLHTLHDTSMIKWAVFKDDLNTRIDYCYLEQTGIHQGLGYCIQESIVRDREVPNLHGFGLKRQQLHHTGYIVQPTDRDDVVQIYSIFQMVSGTLPTSQLEKMMIQRVSAVQRIASLLDRRRLSRTPLLAKEKWIKDEKRRHCALCLKLFALRRKHHCRHCGEVVCSVCAPPREVDIGTCGVALIRVCTACVLHSRNAMKIVYNNTDKQARATSSLGRTQSTPVTTGRELSTQSKSYRRSDCVSLYSLYDDHDSLHETEEAAPASMHPSSLTSSDSNFSIASPSQCSPRHGRQSLGRDSSSSCSWEMEENEYPGYSRESDGLRSFSSSLSSDYYSFSEPSSQEVPEIPSSSRQLSSSPEKTQGLTLYVPGDKTVSPTSSCSESSFVELLASIRDMRADLMIATNTNQQDSSLESFSTRPRSDANTTLMMTSRDEYTMDNQMELITSDSFNLLQPESQQRTSRTSSLSTSSSIHEDESELNQLANHIDTLRGSLQEKRDPDTWVKPARFEDPVVKEQQHAYQTLMEELHEIMGVIH